MKEHKPPKKVVVPKAAPRTPTQKKAMRLMLFAHNCFYMTYSSRGAEASAPIHISATLPGDSRERFWNFKRVTIDKLVRIKLVESDEEASDWKASHYKLTEAGKAEAEGYGNLDVNLLANTKGGKYD